MALSGKRVRSAQVPTHTAEGPSASLALSCTWSQWRPQKKAAANLGATVADV
jgi:hypothetical protein